MKKNKLLIYTIISVFSVSVFCYWGILNILPAVLNSQGAIHYYEKFLTKTFGVPVYIKSLNFTVNPNISFNLSINSILAKNTDGIDVVSIKNLAVVTKSFSINPKLVTANTVYIDYSPLKKSLKSLNKKDSSNKIKIENIPLLKINKIYLKIDNNSNFVLKNVAINKSNELVNLRFFGEFKAPYITKPVIIGSEGDISYSNNLIFNNFSVNLENSKIILSGPIYNLHILAKDLSVNELEKHFLYFYKFKHPGKKNFIENFKDFSGTINANLILKYGNLYGFCSAKNLSAIFSNFKIPVSFANVNFYFRGRNVYASAKGLFGYEDVDTIFALDGLFSKNLVVSGKVHSKLSNKFAKRYFPVVKVIGTADALVKYKTKKGIVDVDYILTLNKGDNLISKYGNLDCIDKNRQISVYTQKSGNIITLTRYNYDFFDKNKRTGLLYGQGVFKKNLQHYKPVYITLKTNGKVPVNVIQSFTRDFIKNGYFSSDVKYSFLNNILAGTLDLYNVEHSDFLFLENTHINVYDKSLKLSANGQFFESPIRMVADVDNQFAGNILIHNIEIYLDKFDFSRDDYSSSLSNVASKYKKSNNTADLNVVVEKGKIHVNDILHDKFQLKNVDILGRLKNNIVDFVIPETVYAKGVLSAKGIYDIKNKSSDIHFFASDIDSNEVVTNIFKLPNQVQGLAYATLHLKAKNKLSDINAHATFAIHDGYMPKLGSTEFIIKKSKRVKLITVDKIKFTLSKITNIDFSNKQVLSSNIYGSFILNNSDVNNIKIFSQSDYFSVFIEGYYNIDSQYSKLFIWGRHNKTEEKKIRILRLPFTFLYRLIFKPERTKDYYQEKVSMIPPIKLKAGDVESLFRVFIKGNLNSENLKVILKDLR